MKLLKLKNHKKRGLLPLFLYIFLSETFWHTTLISLLHGKAENQI